MRELIALLDVADVIGRARFYDTRLHEKALDAKVERQWSPAGRVRSARVAVDGGKPMRADTTPCASTWST